MNAARTSSRRAFSLVELLVAMAVLAILGWLISQIVVTVSRTTKQSNRIIDTASQVRLAYDRIGMDLAGLVKRADVDFVGKNATSTTPYLLQFISRVPTSGTAVGINSAENRGVSVVSYKVAARNENNGLPCLVRAAKAIPWHTVGTIPNTKFMGLQSNGLPIRFTDVNGSSTVGFPSELLSTQDSDYDMLAPGVIRMVVGFQLYPDNNTVTYSTALYGGPTPTPTNAMGQIVYSPPVIYRTPNDGGASQAYIDLSRVSALVVGLVAIDINSQSTLSPVQADSLAAAFAVPSSGTPGTLWAPIASDVSRMPTSVPLPVRQSVRVYERFFPITPFTTQGP